MYGHLTRIDLEVVMLMIPRADRCRSLVHRYIASIDTFGPMRAAHLAAAVVLQNLVLAGWKLQVVMARCGSTCES